MASIHQWVINIDIFGFLGNSVSQLLPESMKYASLLEINGISSSFFFNNLGNENICDTQFQYFCSCKQPQIQWLNKILNTTEHLKSPSPKVKVHPLKNPRVHPLGLYKLNKSK